MLLFSTILDVKNTMTETEFIRLLINANQDYDNFKENIIPVSEIAWDGETIDNFFGHDGLSLSTVKYRNGNIIAARFEKKESNGKRWDTDYIWNITENKICIRLDRAFREGASTTDDKFSPPAFIKYLINADVLMDDGDLPISSEPILITERNIDLLIKAINNTALYRLPIVYVSKNFDNSDPLDTVWLANRLKGVAHVFVETDGDLDFDIRKYCTDKNTYDGRVSIYFPENTFPQCRLNLHHEYTDNGDNFIVAILNEVLRYMNSKEIPLLYTWDGVTIQINNDSLAERKAERDKAREDSKVFAEYAEDRDDTLAELSEKYDKLYQEAEHLRAQNQYILSGNAVDHTNPNISLSLGDEREFFPDEAKEILLETLKAVLPQFKDNNRRYDVLKAIVDNNESPDTLIDKGKTVTKLLKTYTGMTAPLERDLNKLGLYQIRHQDHYEFQYYNDSRYNATFPSTPSAQNSGKKTAEEIKKTMF